ncbi:phage late control D family protein [Phormidium tenue]|uniref:Phage late control D family protein n=1 Tax=Phormidium tenue NIES-30 TaxID=549789 RepID=A0A1U7IXV3_9CYAN|nr:contractile injection system protein, VgrG/Pvc8 family [Phormidium tenue]MBD2233300.1 phage late control D family protein [Phormidium tenue FACHB-1052]OKH43268.1 hypothetical protein NIES30_25290 [Phormidium tenue NIES-30]
MPSRTTVQLLSPTLDIRRQGRPLSSSADQDLWAATVAEDLDAPGMFTLHLRNWDFVQGQFSWVDDDTFCLGTEIQVAMGHQGRPMPLITGEITGLEPEFSQDGEPMLTVRGYDLSYRLAQGQKTRSFAGMKDSAIASQIAQNHRLSAKVDDSGETLDYVLQNNQSDLAFLQTRAQRIGYEVFVTEKTLHFRAPKHKDAKALSLDWNRDLLEFTPRLSILGQVAAVKIEAWNVANQSTQLTSITADGVSAMAVESGPEAASNLFGDDTFAQLTTPLRQVTEATSMAKGQLNAIALSYITGDGLCVGNPQLRAGTVVEFTGLGKRFSGLYYIVTTEHTLSQQDGYLTAFTFRRNAA